MNIENADGCWNFTPFAPYDASAGSHDGRSYIGSPELGADAVFSRLATDAAPFDTCVFLRSDKRSVVAETRTAFAKTRFAAFGRGRAAQAALGELSVLL